MFVLSCSCSRFPNEQHAKKAWKRNQDLTMTVLPTRQAAQIHYDLYERYLMSAMPMAICFRRV